MSLLAQRIVPLSRTLPLFTIYRYLLLCCSSSGRAIASVTSDDETDQLDGSVHPSPPSLTYDLFAFRSLKSYMIYFFREPLVIVPAKVDMRAEYCPSALLVDGCPMELGSGAFEFFDEDINRSVRYSLIPQKLIHCFFQESRFCHLLQAPSTVFQHQQSCGR